MLTRHLLLPLLLSPLTLAQSLPPPPSDHHDFPISYAPEAPGTLAADALLDKPAGRLGPVAVKNGHFYTDDKRLRLWGVNIAFAGCFPTHEQADAVAARLARFGINAVRLHHMDNQPFPGGIFADRTLEKLSPDALDRLDYFVNALKQHGVYSNLNLHVSRPWSRTHDWPKAEQLPESYDKMLDVFDPELIAANKQYARDLLTHVNAYTKTRYADEPAVCIVEINNEDTLFLWGGESKLRKLPEPYAGNLQKLWNQWLQGRYRSAANLRTAWAEGAQPLGENLLRDTDFQSLAQPKSSGNWVIESHAPAKMTASVIEAPQEQKAARLTVTATDGTDWHLQFHQPGLHLKKSQFYTVRFLAKSDKPTILSVGVSQAHEPWTVLAALGTPALERDFREYQFAFTCPADEANARLAFAVGHTPATIDLVQIQLRPGGQVGLADAEDPARGNVARPGVGPAAVSPARADDWYAFLQATDQKYWLDMYQFLKNDLGVKAPITGTIGLGALGTLSQSHMDFVDAHAYWDHPRFPHRPWDSSDWLITNKPMVDNPAGATLWKLAATRVEGKPFTVTEYNHAAPNDWQAECVPFISAYAALQDWDGIFLFAYSHNADYQKKRISSYFDIEGNPTKMLLSPMAARLFLTETIQPLASQQVIHPHWPDMLRTAPRYYNDLWPFLHDTYNVQWESALTSRLAINFDQGSPPPLPPGEGRGEGSSPSTQQSALSTQHSADPRVTWTAPSPAAGRFTLRDPAALVFVGFPAGKSIDLGPVQVEQIDTPFATLIITPAEPGQNISTAPRLLMTAVARAENTGMQWDKDRHTVSNHWGGEPVRIEPVKATLSLAGERPLSVFALDPSGNRGPRLNVDRQPNRNVFTIGRDNSAKTPWYELVRE